MIRVLVEVERNINSAAEDKNKIFWKTFGKYLENISQKNSLHSRKKSIQQLLSKGQNKEETSSMTGSQREEYIW